MAEEDEEHDWDEEDEDDFVPDADDDDGDYDLQEELDNQADDDADAIPTFLEGELFMDTSKGLCYEQPGVFCLVCQTALEEPFQFHAPPLGRSLQFSGWIQDPTEWLEFRVTVSKQVPSLDPLDQKLLDAQDKKNQESAISRDATKTGDDNDDEPKKMASPTKGNLKSPPSYSVVDDAKSSSKNLKAAPPPPSRSVGDNDVVYFISGAQIIESNGKTATPKRKINFRGAYRVPKGTVERLWVISSVQLHEAAATVTTSATSTEGSAAAPTAASRKRRLNDDDDDSVEGAGGVEYQELIDLHDEAGLSTEELRRRYYDGSNIPSSAPEEQVNETNGGEDDATKPPATEEEEEDDHDDDYGF